MFEASNENKNETEYDRNFQKRMKKFKDKWLNNWNEKSGQLVVQKKPSESKAQATIKSSNKRVCRMSTINPASTIKKNTFCRSSVEKFETAQNEYPAFIDKSNVKKTRINLDSSKKTFRSQTTSIPTLGQRQKYKRKRSECLEKLRNSRDYRNLSSSESDAVSKAKAKKRNYINNNTNCTKENENTWNENVRQQSFFRLASPKLFRINTESDASRMNNFAQSTVTITSDLEIESSELTSDGSFSFQKIKLKSRSVMIQKTENHRQISSPLRSNDLQTCSNRVHNRQSEIQQNDVFSWLSSLNRLDKKVDEFNDESENSLSFPLKYNDKVSVTRPNTFIEKKYTSSDAELKVDSFAAFNMKPQDINKDSSCEEHKYKIYRNSNFRLNCVEKNQNRHSSGFDLQRCLSSEKKTTQWCSIPDSLESSFTSSREKLTEVKDFF